MGLARTLQLGGVALGVAWVIKRAREQQDLPRLRGLKIAITGGSRGLGLVLARQCLAQGATVALCARDAEELATAMGQLQEKFPRATVHGIRCDVTSADDARRFVAEAGGLLGGLDVLINNAGTIQVGPWSVMNEADLVESIQVHILAPWHTINAAYPDLRQSRGRVINIASIGGKVAVPHLLPYDTGKFGLVGLSQALSAELAEDGITVTTVCPGLMRTGSPRNAWFKGRHREEYTWFSIGDSLPLLTVSAEDAARRILSASIRRKRHLVFPLQMKAAVIAHELAPELTTSILSAVNRLLPAPGGVGSRRLKGARSKSLWSPSALTYLNERAAAANNQFDVEPGT